MNLSSSLVNARGTKRAEAHKEILGSARGGGLRVVPEITFLDQCPKDDSDGECRAQEDSRITTLCGYWQWRGRLSKCFTGVEAIVYRHKYSTPGSW